MTERPDRTAADVAADTIETFWIVDEKGRRGDMSEAARREIARDILEALGIDPDAQVNCDGGTVARRPVRTALDVGTEVVTGFRVLVAPPGGPYGLASVDERTARQVVEQILEALGIDPDCDADLLRAHLTAAARHVEEQDGAARSEPPEEPVVIAAPLTPEVGRGCRIAGDSLNSRRPIWAVNGNWLWTGEYLPKGRLIHVDEIIEVVP